MYPLEQAAQPFVCQGLHRWFALYAKATLPWTEAGQKYDCSPYAILEVTIPYSNFWRHFRTSIQVWEQCVDLVQRLSVLRLDFIGKSLLLVLGQHFNITVQFEGCSGFTAIAPRTGGSCGQEDLCQGSSSPSVVAFRDALGNWWLDYCNAVYMVHPWNPPRSYSWFKRQQCEQWRVLFGMLWEGRLSENGQHLVCGALPP